MKSFRILVMIGMAVVSGSWLQANPRISILNGCCSSPVGSTFTQDNLTINSNGGGLSDLFNNTNTTWTEVDLVAHFASAVDPSTFLCGAIGSNQISEGDHSFNQISAFEHCSFSFNTDTNTLTAKFFGTVPPEDAPLPNEVEDSPEGVAPGGSFVIDLTNLIPNTTVTDSSTPCSVPRSCIDDPTGAGGWSGVTMTFTASPEPRLIGLLLTAFGGMLLARRRFRSPR